MFERFFSRRERVPMEKYLVVIFRNLDRLRYDLTRVAYPRYFGEARPEHGPLLCSPLHHLSSIMAFLFAWNCSPWIGDSTFPRAREKVAERGGNPSCFHFHLLSKHKWNIRDVIDNSLSSFFFAHQLRY